VPKRYLQGSGRGKEGYIRIAALDALPIKGEPQRFPVISNLSDSWNFVPDQAIVAVFLQRVDQQQVRVFNATCPHAGCSVSFRNGGFHCPCHNSSFQADGTKLGQSGKENPSPRPLDSLDVDPEMLAQGEVWIKFQNFYTGREEKTPKP
jgi:Rieske Fe-S protein